MSIPNQVLVSLLFALAFGCGRSSPPANQPAASTTSEATATVPVEVTGTDSEEPSDIAQQETDLDQHLETIPAETDPTLLATESDTQVGHLKVRFVYGGDPPAPRALLVNAIQPFCGRQQLIDERLLVNSENQGIRNVLVYVYTGRGGVELPEQPLRNQTHTLANQNCRFEPRIVIAQAGDKLDITNPDPVGHNANLAFFNNPPQNVTVAPGNKVTIDLAKDEPAPIPVLCNIHPWMQGRVAVFEHPFAAVSDENGDLLIKGIPTGDMVFRVWAEAAPKAIGEVTIDGKEADWGRKNLFELEIKAGMNDMGTVVIPADALSAD